MISKEYVVLSPEGIHAGPAKTLLKVVKQFKSQVMLKKGDMEINAKSMLEILTLAAKCGEKVAVTINGDDENEAEEAIEELFLVTLKNM